MKMLIVILLIVQFLSQSYISLAQDEYTDIPSNNMLIVQYDENSGISQVIQIDVETRNSEVLLELGLLSSKIVKDSLSLSELEAVETVFKEDKSRILNRNLAQRIKRSWLINTNNVILEIEYSTCDRIPQEICFGYTEYGVLSDDSNYQAIVSIDYHGEIHRDRHCSYAEILIGHDVRIYQESRTISIQVVPQCNTTIVDVYTLILQENSSEEWTSSKIPSIAGLSIYENNIAYYQLSCKFTDCSVRLTVVNQNQDSIFTSEDYPTPLDKALYLDLTWVNENTLFYQQYDAEPDAHYNFYTVDIVTGEEELKFGDYTPWQKIYHLSDKLVGYFGSYAIIVSDPIRFITRDALQILDSGSDYLVYAEGKDCLDKFIILDADLTTSEFDIQELLGTSGCVLDITFLT